MMSMITYLQSLQNGLKTIFKEDEKVLLLGEDILYPYGGTFKVSGDLSLQYPSRVLTTPISEAAIIGVGAGLAIRGFHPIVEIMFGDFLPLCADQIINHASKFSDMYVGVSCPLIIRTPMGGRRGYGPTHSQTLEKMFLGTTGLKIIAPSLFHQPGEILRMIVKNETTPTIFIENKTLYNMPLHLDSTVLNIKRFYDEFGYEVVCISNYADGTADVNLVIYGGTSSLIEEILLKMYDEEIKVSCIIPSCIDPFPLEIVSSLAKAAGRIVVVEEGAADFGWSEGVAAKLYSKLWSDLTAPIATLSSCRSIIPTSSVMERAVLVDSIQIENAIIEALS